MIFPWFPWLFIPIHFISSFICFPYFPKAPLVDFVYFMFLKYLKKFSSSFTLKMGPRDWVRSVWTLSNLVVSENNKNGYVVGFWNFHDQISSKI